MWCKKEIETFKKLRGRKNKPDDKLEGKEIQEDKEKIEIKDKDEKDVEPKEQEKNITNCKYICTPI